MTPEGHNDLFPILENILKQADVPLDCNELYDMQTVRTIAPSVNRVSDYLGVLFRRGKVSRVPAERDGTNRARWKYIWRDKGAPAWRKPPGEVVDYKPKALLDKPNIYIAEDGGHIHIQMPNLSITIKQN